MTRDLRYFKDLALRFYALPVHFCSRLKVEWHCETRNPMKEAVEAVYV